MKFRLLALLANISRWGIHLGPPSQLGGARKLNEANEQRRPPTGANISLLVVKTNPLSLHRRFYLARKISFAIELAIWIGRN